MRADKRMSIAEFVADPDENYNHMSETFLHDFWDEKLNLDSHHLQIIVNRAHYCLILGNDRNPVQAEWSDGTVAGFGGRRFDIEFFDGRKISTNNLWYQGVIPTDYDETLPDNAKFLEPHTLERLGWNE